MPMDRAKYPKNWVDISKRVRFVRAQGRCECEGECGRGHSCRCEARNGLPHPETGSRVVITVAHLYHDMSDDESRMRAMCQACNLAYDSKQHAATARKTREARSGQQRLGGL